LQLLTEIAALAEPRACRSVSRLSLKTKSAAFRPRSSEAEAYKQRVRQSQFV
jgi:hypothetical protein